MLPFFDSAEDVSGDEPGDATGAAVADETTADGLATNGLPLETVLEGLAAPTVVVDDGATITEANGPALELFEESRSGLVGTSADGLLDLEEGADDWVSAALETGEDQLPSAVEATLDDTELMVERSVKLLHSEGAVVGAVVVVRDVTEQVEQRQRTEALEAYQQSVLERLQSDLRQLADGDLTVDPTVPEPDAEFAEIQTVYEAFRDTNDDVERVVENLRSVVGGLTEQSEGIASTSDTLSASSEEVTASIEEIDASSTQLATGAEQLASETDRADRNVDNLTASIEEITASADQMQDTAADATDLTEQGVGEIRTALGEIREATDSASQVATDISSLEASMQEVGDIVALISDIAEQTNILALNANIEAARAGVEGEGFAVVADEVKTLAERSQSAAKDIDGIIEQAQNKTDALAGSIRDANQQVETGADAVDDAADTVETIQDRIEDTSRSVAEIADAVESQAHSTEEVRGVVDDTTAMAQEISASIQQISASIDEQAQAMDQVADRAQFLSTTSDDMHGLVDLFKLSADEHAEMDGIDDAAVEDAVTVDDATETQKNRQKAVVDGGSSVAPDSTPDTDDSAADTPDQLEPDDF